MQPRTIVITGGNTGLGLACARACARTAGVRVILACRDPDRARETIGRLIDETRSPDIEAMALDLASLRSVRRFASDLDARKTEPVSALVCNAGVQIVTEVTTTEDGFETTFAVNHLGHFLLSNLLLPRMPARSRIIFVSSDTHDPEQRTGMPAPRLGDMRAMARGEGAAGDSRAASGRRRYTTSKLCNVLCAYEMSRRIAARAGAPRATVNAFDPGLMPGTSLARDYRPIERFAWSYLLPVLTLFMKNVNTVWTSGRRLAELALDPAYEGVTGRYFSRGREAPSSTESHDLEKARELWELSSELVGQEPSETWPSA